MNTITTVSLNSADEKIGVELYDVTIVSGGTTSPARTFPAVKAVKPDGVAASEKVHPGMIVLGNFGTSQEVVSRIENGPFPLVLQFFDPLAPSAEARPELSKNNNNKEDRFKVVKTGGDQQQVKQLKKYLNMIMVKQDLLKKNIAKKHDKAITAKRLSRNRLRNVLVDVEDTQTHHHHVEVVETPGIEQRLDDYAESVEECEKGFEEMTELVHEIEAALHHLPCH